MADIVHPVGAVVQVPGDRNDDVTFATLVVAKADWLITGDAALLELADHAIIAVADFAAPHLG